MSGLNDFLFGSNDAAKATQKAASNAQWSPFLYAGPGDSLSGFGSLTPQAAPTGGTAPGGPSPAPGGNGGYVVVGKSDGKGYPVVMDPNTGVTYAQVNGSLVPAKGGIILSNGTKVTSVPGQPIPNWYQYRGAAPAGGTGAAPTPNGGVQQQIPSAPSPVQAAQAGPNLNQMSLGAGGANIAPGPAGNTNPFNGPVAGPGGAGINPEMIGGQTAFGNIGNLDPIQRALVAAFPELTQSGVRQSGGTNTAVDPGASPYNAFGDVYQHNLDLLRQQAKPGEDQATAALQNRLYSQGRLGSTGGNMNIEAFAKGLGEADVSRQLQAFNVSQGVAQQQEQARLANAGITAQNIDRAIQQGQLTFQQAQQLFGNIASLNQIGSQNFTNALNASIAKSNANAGAAGALAQVPADNGAFGSILSAAGNAVKFNVGA